MDNRIKIDYSNITDGMLREMIKELEERVENVGDLHTYLKSECNKLKLELKRREFFD